MAAHRLKPGKTKTSAGSAFRGILFLSIGILLLVLSQGWDPCNIQSTESMRPEDPVLSSLRKEAERVADAFIEKNSAALAESARLDLGALETAVRRLEVTFDEKEAAVEDLLDDLFSLSVEAQVLYHWLGGMEEVGRYVHSVVETRWGAANEIQAEITAVTEALAMDLQGNHNQLMLALEADLRALPVSVGAGQNPSATLEENFRKSFGRLISEKIPAVVAGKLAADILAGFYTFRPCSLALERAAMAVSSRVAGVSAGRATLAAAKCGTSVVSLGASIAVGLALDWAITEAAKVDVRGDLLQSLHAWRDETVAGFRNEVAQAMRRGWELRVQELREAVTQEALAYLKTQSNS